MVVTWKFTLPAFVVPFAFTLDPRGMGLLLQTDWPTIVLTSGTALVGIVGLAIAFAGVWLRSHQLVSRALAGAGGALLLHPAPAADLAGLVALATAIVAGRMAVRR
jgi:TRAP-type uncharacterized transport system fused permease subunit